MRTILLSACAAPLLLLAACDEAAPGAGAARGDILIDDPRAFPESITATRDGTVIVGGTQGKVFRAAPGETVARTWIESTPENGMLGVFGVLADDDRNLLWVCSIPDLFGGAAPQDRTALMAFDLDSAAPRGAWPFPDGPSGGGICNDIAIGPDGAAYATDTPGGRILRLADPGADALELFGEDPSLRGVDGIAFADDGTMYVNNVQTHELVRVDAGPDGLMGGLTVLTLSQPIEGPDAFRPLGGARFLVSEGPPGRIVEAVIEGDHAQITTISDAFASAPGATPAGDVAYVIEGQIEYLLNPDLRDSDPPPFRAYEVPLNSTNNPGRGQ